MKKKKLTTRQKVINRIQRRLQTKINKGEVLNVKPTKKNIDEILKANNIKVTKSNANDVVDSVVKKSNIIGKDEAKSIKKELGARSYKDVYKITGKELHDIIAKKYDDDLDDEAEAILAAYGY